MKAIEYVLDRMDGKPVQSVELSGYVSHHLLSEAEKETAKRSLEEIHAWTMEEEDLRVGSFIT
jgi:hypothetical protein